MLEMGRIGQVDGQYEFRDPSRGLVVRGPHPEWVLQAAAEVIGNLVRLESDGLLAELTAMRDLGAVDHAEMTATHREHRERFAISPRCNVALGPARYFWSCPDAPGLKPDAVAATPLILAPQMLVPSL